MPSFNKDYAQIYDTLYAGKDYGAEVALIEKLVGQHLPGRQASRPRAKRVVDYGCGTGSHSAVLAKKGYEVFSVDINKNMLTLAKKKLQGLKNISVIHTSQRNKIKPGSVDVFLTMFDIVSYMKSNKELNDFFRYVGRSLGEGGLFIFDFWHGPGVINLCPEKRWKEYKAGKMNILRLTTPSHDMENNIVNVKHELIISKANRIIKRFKDPHTMRYFSCPEIELLLSSHNLKLIKFGTLENIDNGPTRNDWSCLAVAKR